jgi:hypothetical protein
VKFASAFAFAGMIAFSSAAGAAALTGSPLGNAGASGPSLVEQIHDGNTHRGCELGRRGWHRHDRYGERIPCSPPSYGRPQYQESYRQPPPRRCVKDWHCEKAGPFGIEKRCYWRDLCN